ncbi:CbtA family protein [Arenibaculum pallidiluteum]|uniref:CbtA family protein n=1 Tax=Arenibaculum pallidiluteum TaxID=2812559 RepID=UPI001A95D8EA|nr:CbtA family protein [Arenibaculum pallidiluteum]
MLRRILLAALAAGLSSAVLVTAVQSFTTTPLILLAETFEAAAETAGETAAAEAGHDHGGHNHGGHDHGGHEHGVGHDHDLAFTGGARLGLTAMANAVTGVGFALLAVACFALSGRRIDERAGLGWGMAGFAVFGLAPALGLPPELPGMAAAELTARQGWWLAASAGAAAGLWLVVFGRFRGAAALGLLVSALPHLVGAPAHDAAGGTVPAELAARFAATALAVNALFWAVLGWTAGAVWRRVA